MLILKVYIIYAVCKYREFPTARDKLDAVID
jgi:hypothetical protein